jgi:dihydropteroate synthase
MLSSASGALGGESPRAEIDRCLEQAERMIADGADLLDAGVMVDDERTSEAEELDRLVPIVEALCHAFDVPVSVNTTKASVAAAGFRAGALIGNDLSGFSDPDYLSVAADSGASVVAGLGPYHLPPTPRPERAERDLIGEVERYLCERAECAVEHGIPANRVIADPGPLDRDYSYWARLFLRGSSRLASLGYPVLLSSPEPHGPKRLSAEPADTLLAESLAATSLGIVAGCRLVRTSDVSRACRVRDLLASIMESAPECEALPEDGAPSESVGLEVPPARSR